VISPTLGGATGTVWYSTTGSTFHFDLRATDLKPGVHYLIEMYADGDRFEVSSHSADPHGAIALDTTVAQFASGVCYIGDYVPPHALIGSHKIKFLIKRDGGPVDGTQPPDTRAQNQAPALPCHGNGDKDYTYALYEDNVAQYVGTR
jgi:hypothetical protein